MLASRFETCRVATSACARFELNVVGDIGTEIRDVGKTETDCWSCLRQFASWAEPESTSHAWRGGAAEETRLNRALFTTQPSRCKFKRICHFYQKFERSSRIDNKYQRITKNMVHSDNFRNQGFADESHTSQWTALDPHTFFSVPVLPICLGRSCGELTTPNSSAER